MDVIGLTQVRSTPYLLAVVLGTLALVTIAHALVTSVRRRRHEVPVVPWLTVAGIAASAVLTANVLAALPASAARRVPIARVLRTE